MLCKWTNSSATLSLTKNVAPAAGQAPHGPSTHGSMLKTAVCRKVAERARPWDGPDSCAPSRTSPFAKASARRPPPLARSRPGSRSSRQGGRTALSAKRLGEMHQKSAPHRLLVSDRRGTDDDETTWEDSECRTIRPQPRIRSPHRHSIRPAVRSTDSRESRPGARDLSRGKRGRRSPGGATPSKATMAIGAPTDMQGLRKTRSTSNAGARSARFDVVPARGLFNC